MQRLIWRTVIIVVNKNKIVKKNKIKEHNQIL